MRVIAGSAGGRRLVAPPGTTTRPTSDRAKEALFSSLAAEVPAARVLDLYAGSGALGIEALSRGAEHATFVERDRRALRCLRTNLRVTGLHDAASVVATDVAAFCRATQPVPFDLVLCDPPYAEPTATVWALLGDLRAAGGLGAGTTVVVERDRRDPGLAGPVPGFLASRGQRPYGDTVLWVLHGLREVAGTSEEGG